MSQIKSGGLGGGGGAGDSVSRNFYHVITAEDAGNKYFDLPESVYSKYADKTILTVETDVQAPTEYEVTTDGDGRLRRVSWAGRGLETDPPMREGWRCWVLYYVSAGSAPPPGETIDHSTLDGRDLPNQHPIGAISGLEEALAAKQDTLTAGSGVKINDAAVSLDTATPAEAIAGTNAEKVMTPLTTRGAIDSTPAGNPAAIFASPGAADMGTRTVTVTDAAASKSPMYMLYGTAGTQIYLVQTYGSASRIEQRAVLLDNSSREFERQCVGSAWSAWRELPTFAYAPGNLTLIVDGENGDDATAKGTETLPYKTIQAALNAVPVFCPSSAVTVKIKAGTYNITSPLSLSNRYSATLTITSYSGQSDVEIVLGAETNNVYLLFLANISARVGIYYLNFKSVDASKTACGVFMSNTNGAIIHNCGFHNFRYTATDDGRGSGIYFLWVPEAAIYNCSFENVVNGVTAHRSAVTIRASVTAIADVDYGVYAVCATVCAQAAIPGTIANSRIDHGQVL
jgi:hypothetical protein